MAFFNFLMLAFGITSSLFCHQCQAFAVKSDTRASQRATCVRGGVGDINIGEQAESDLLIIGAGYLGKLIGKSWLEKFPGASVYAETRSDSKHSLLREDGMLPILRSDREDHPTQSWKNIIFCASPSGNEDYPGELEAAVQLWDKTGGFVFTSSGGIFAENAGGYVTTESPVADSPRAQKLVDAENIVLNAGGSVVRLAGLYDTQRGAHNFWLSKVELDSNPDGIINQIHYEDAALVTIAALLKQEKGKIYIAADGNPLTRSGICDAALQCSIYKGKSAPKFLKPSDESEGKIYDMTQTFEKLNWTPKYPSFSEYMQSH